MSARRLGWVCAGLALIARPAALPAMQLGGTIDVGTGPVSWDRAGAREPLLQGAVGASYRAPLLLGVRSELIGELGLSTEPADRTAIRWDLGARLHTSGAITGAWLGGGIGGAGVGSPSSELTRLEGGIRHAIGPAGFNIWMARTTFGSGIAARGGLGQDSAPQLDTLARNGVTEYTDLGSRATLELGRYELGVTFTRRLGDAGIRSTGWELSATWWAASSVGVVGAAGRSLPQFGLAVPGGRYGTVGLRLALGATPRVDRDPPKPAEARSATAPRLVVAGRRLTITWAPALQAEVMGDFTDWEPRVMVPMGAGRWMLPIALAPGVHHLNVRFDGGAWVVPSGAVAVDDGFGGRVGLVVVR